MPIVFILVALAVWLVAAIALLALRRRDRHIAVERPRRAWIGPGRRFRFDDDPPVAA